MNAIDVLEIAARGGAATVAVLLAGALARIPSAVGRLGGLFALGSAAYALISSPMLGEAVGPVHPALRVLATYNSVLFWWFATALLDDGFRWRSWRAAPAAAITLIVLLRAGSGDARVDTAGDVALEIVVLLVLAHALALAARGLGADLVEPRRRFRVVFVALAGTLGVAIAVAELALLRGPIPEVLSRLHALALLTLALGFAIWAVRAREDLFAATTAARDSGAWPAQVSVEDRALLERLQAAMGARAYAEPNLTVARLAARLGTQEHRLRKVINQGLGYRNFTTFLNERRIADAEAALADPAQARRQILQVALDLGYGSIGPFNRAFKDATGLTPTEYRKAALLRLGRDGAASGGAEAVRA